MQDKAEGDSGISAPKHTIPEKLELEKNVMSKYKVDRTKIHTYGVHVIGKVSGMREGGASEPLTFHSETHNHHNQITGQLHIPGHPDTGWKFPGARRGRDEEKMRLWGWVQGEMGVERQEVLLMLEPAVYPLHGNSQCKAGRDPDSAWYQNGAGDVDDVCCYPKIRVKFKAPPSSLGRSRALAPSANPVLTELTTFLAQYTPITPVAIACKSPTENTSRLPAALIPGVLRAPFNLGEVKPNYPCIHRLIGTISMCPSTI
ncbi:hypothetical protein B0H14DRAFT_2594325 [Mycena olivaceomarginata]|nr:hypothetical protein B0H14DRAFT_2594325 [Mycena olivaceomarginata]